MKIAVLGAGAWGTALAAAWATEHTVGLWARSPDFVVALQRARANIRYLPGVDFPDALSIESDLGQAVGKSDVTVLAVATGGLAATLARLPANFDQPLIWVCKGFETGSGRLPHEVVADWRKGHPVAVLSGPSFASEVAHNCPTALTLASPDADLADRLARALALPRLRVYASDDVVGVEIGGALKNVMAIAAGVCDGLQLGHNARAALMTRGLAEMTRLGVAMGGRPETFMGLSGLGDLILTATGDLSRNRRVGLALAVGTPLTQILADLGHVAEGVTTAREIIRRASQLGVDMPIAHGVSSLLFDGMPAASVVEALLARSLKSEF